MPTATLARAAFATCCVIAVTAPACKRSGHPTSAPVRVAAAADLAHAFPEVGRAFEAQTGQKVEFSFGASGLLAKQLADGAPYDVFAAANSSFVDEAVAAGACDGATKAQYARGRLVAWVSKSKGIAPPTTLAELRSDRFVKIAIANPEHAPYGRAAKQALQRAGVWQAVEPKIVYGENVVQTMQFAESGNAEVALVALSLARAHPDGAAVDIDASLHDPLDQALVACSRGKASEPGRAFAQFVNSPSGRAIMTRFGFLLPAEAATASAGSP